MKRIPTEGTCPHNCFFNNEHSGHYFIVSCLKELVLYLEKISTVHFTSIRENPDRHKHSSHPGLTKGGGIVNWLGGGGGVTHAIGAVST